MKRTIILTYAVALCLCAKMYAQVGINTEIPNPMSNLEIKNAIASNGDTLFRGVMIPRMTEAQRDRIVIPANDSLANSLMIYNTTEDCFNYYMKAEKEWKSLCGTEGLAKFEMNCNTAIKVHGVYMQNVSMNSSNCLTVTVDVKKKGTWTITASTATSNGFSFFGTGIFTETGLQTIQIPATGEPKYPSLGINNPDPGHGQLTVRTAAGNCTVPIEVYPLQAKYSFFCESANDMASGKYMKGNALGIGESIKVHVRVITAGSYHIYTETLHGISFSRRGYFTSTDIGDKILEIPGTGTPTIHLDFDIEIKARTPDGETACKIKVPVTMPELTYALIGNDAWYSVRAEGRREAFGAGSPAFGSTNGVLRVEKLTELFALTNSNKANVIKYLDNGYNGKFPDVVLYYAFATAPTADIAAALARYVNRGGCLMFSPTDGDLANTQILISGIFGDAHCMQQYNGTNGNPSRYSNDCCYRIADRPGDPIINGPFGNLSNKYWCEDNGSEGTIIMTELPANSVQVCSAYDFYSKPGVDPAFSAVWYNDAKNFVYIGDTNGSSISDNSNSSFPSVYTSAGMPRTKIYGNAKTTTNVNNASGTNPLTHTAHLECNAIAWLFKKAVTNGVNPH